MSKNRVNPKGKKPQFMNEDNEELLQQHIASRSNSPNPREEERTDVSLQSILNELKDFRRDNKQHLTEIKQELCRTINRLTDGIETTLMAATALLKRLSQRQANMDHKKMCSIQRYRHR